MKCPNCQVELRLTKVSGGGEQSVPVSDLGALLSECEGQPMDAWNQEFYRKLRERFEQYGEATFVSEKQLAILRKIATGNGGERDPF
jgi:hypothetical protein